MSQKFSREERLYILAKALTGKHITPDMNTYAGYIIGVSAANFYRTKEAALEDAETLTAAYKADQWRSILAEETTPTETQPTYCAVSPSLNEYKTFAPKTPCTPIKRIAPPNRTAEPEDTPFTQALRLLKLAEMNIWNGAGRVTLSEARYEFSDKTLTVQDMLRLFREHMPLLKVEQRAGNTVYVYMNEGLRCVKVVVPPAPPVLNAPREYYVEPPLETDCEVYDDTEADVVEDI